MGPNYGKNRVNLKKPNVITISLGEKLTSEIYFVDSIVSVVACFPA